MQRSWKTLAIGTDGKRCRCRVCGTERMAFNVKNSFPVPKYTLKDGTILLGKAPVCLRVNADVQIHNGEANRPETVDQVRIPLHVGSRNDKAPIKGGLQVLNKAIELKPNDTDSMAYLSLMYRQKSEIDPDNETRTADLKMAEDWVNKSLAARKAGASGSSEGSSTVTQQ